MIPWVRVEGALFSVGDAHGAQGDGEVCMAVEMNARITLKFDVMAGRNLPEPQLRIRAAPAHAASRPH